MKANPGSLYSAGGERGSENKPYTYFAPSVSAALNSSPTVDPGDLICFEFSCPFSLLSHSLSKIPSSRGLISPYDILALGWAVYSFLLVNWISVLFFAREQLS